MAHLSDGPALWPHSCRDTKIKKTEAGESEAKPGTRRSEDL